MSKKIKWYSYITTVRTERVMTRLYIVYLDMTRDAWRAVTRSVWMGLKINIFFICNTIIYTICIYIIIVFVLSSNIYLIAGFQHLLVFKQGPAPCLNLGPPCSNLRALFKNLQILINLNWFKFANKSLDFLEKFSSAWSNS
jgi:hypothetical protein